MRLVTRDHRDDGVLWFGVLVAVAVDAVAVGVVWTLAVVW